MLQFMRNLIGVKADKAVQAGVEALVRWDPQSASEAEMRSMEQHLDELGQQVARARQSYDKESREADAIQSLSTQRMAAAEHLQAQVAAEADPAKTAELERSLTTLVTMLEQMAPEVDREKKDAVDAKDFLEMLEKTYADAGGKLREGRSQLERAQRDMARAGQQRQMAEQQADAARRAAGLSTTTSTAFPWNDSYHGDPVAARRLSAVLVGYERFHGIDVLANKGMRAAADEWFISGWSLRRGYVSLERSSDRWSVVPAGRTTTALIGQGGLGLNPMTVAEQLATHAIDTGFADLPVDARQRAAVYVLDSLGVGIAGSSVEGGRGLLRVASGWGAPSASVWGRGERLSAPAAAFINAWQMHNQEYDCLHEGAVVHAMASVLPVARAAAETRGGVSGAELIVAVAVGVDVAAGLGLASTSRFSLLPPGDRRRVRRRCGWRAFAWP